MGYNQPGLPPSRLGLQPSHVLREETVLGEIAVDANLSLGAVLESLQERIAHLRQMEAEHAEREAFHREGRTACAAELEKVIEHFESLRRNVTAVAVMGLLPSQAAGLPLGKKATINLAVREVVSRLPSDRPFGPREIMEEINRLYAERLGGPVKARQVSVSLRWMARTRRIHQVEKGTSHRSSRYMRAKPSPADAETTR